MTEQVNEQRAQNKTFRLSNECISVIQLLAERFTKEAHFPIPMGKVVELAIFECKDKNLKELLHES